MAGPARLLRDLEDRVQPASPLVTRWPLGRVLRELRRGRDTPDRDGAWTVGVDSTVVRAHQHAAGARRHRPSPAAAAGDVREG